MTDANSFGPLDKIERIPLGHWPTPLQPLDRLSDSLGGPRIWMKRDDCSGLAFGGNKARKLEYLMAEATGDGAGTIITVGGVQSNHACQTAAAAAKLGLQCDLVLVRVVPGRASVYETSGNIPAEKLFGARVHIVDDEDAAFVAVAGLIEKADHEGSPAYLIPAGGSTPVGALGFVRAAFELKKQEDQRGRQFDRIVLATSTAGTLAGLAVGFSICKAERPLEAIMVYDSSNHLRPVAETLVHQIAERLCVPSPGLNKIHFLDDYLGDGYGLPAETTREALTLLAEKEGVLVDPVYTGKAMAGLVDLVRRGAILKEEEVLFWHTGGAVALFAYPQFT